MGYLHSKVGNRRAERLSDSICIGWNSLVMAFPCPMNVENWHASMAYRCM